MHNLAEHNKGGGFLVADDLGPTHFDAVTWNVATRNPGGCGVIIAGHSTSGVWGNYVAHNLLDLQRPQQEGARGRRGHRHGGQGRAGV